MNYLKTQDDMIGVQPCCVIAPLVAMSFTLHITLQDYINISPGARGFLILEKKRLHTNEWINFKCGMISVDNIEWMDLD